MRLIYSTLIFFFAFSLASCRKSENPVTNAQNKTWRFAVLSDTHVTINSDTIKEMIPFLLKDSISLVLVCGDLVEGGKMKSPALLDAEFSMWRGIFQPLYDKGIGIYPVRGNHEDDAINDIEVWNKHLSGSGAMPQNGPVGEVNLTYSFNYKNAMFIGLDNYINIHKVNQEWLTNQLAANKQTHLFVFGHEPAYKVFHTDCLDDFPAERNLFWKSLASAGAKTYFCGHDHFYDAALIDDGDGNKGNDLIQCVVGGGGGWLMSKYSYNGTNSPYKVNAKYHRIAHGYALVEISGESSDDKNITITWKERRMKGNAAEYYSTDDVINF